MSHDSLGTSLTGKRAAGRSVRSVKDVVDGVIVVAGSCSDSLPVLAGSKRADRFPTRSRQKSGYRVTHTEPLGGNTRPAAAYRIVDLPRKVSDVFARAVLDTVTEAERVERIPPAPAPADLLRLIGEVTEVRRGRIFVHTADPADPGEELEITLLVKDVDPDDREALTEPGTVVEMAVRQAPDGTMSFLAKPASRVGTPPPHRR